VLKANYRKKSLFLPCVGVNRREPKPKPPLLAVNLRLSITIQCSNDYGQVMHDVQYQNGQQPSLTVVGRVFAVGSQNHNVRRLLKR